MIYVKENPHLFDKVITEIEQGIEARIPWMDNIFGRAETLTKEQNGKYYANEQRSGKRFRTPNWYKGNDEYIQLLPDDMQLGNYCFFVLDEPNEINNEQGSTALLKTDFAVIFWLDMRRAETEDTRDTEGIKEEILSVLNSVLLREGRVKFNKIYERPENVFRGYDYDIVDNQYMMSPFTAFKFEGEILIKETCRI